ncbi:helix-turn-helix transcriptional regulator [Ethanoligenens harbinense]|uniref:helix-turn-helix transcriptional regulator n=1 Tax=Ethanoligenens harbinense TaxID=253239 RepID=UPI00131CFB05|nr:helix-turn-helix domain-containing protein [Ethanoligenens harbinense]
MIKQVLAERLKYFRIKNKLTANQVGVMIGKSGKTVNAWEHCHGQPDADTLLRLCKIYSISNINELYGKPFELEESVDSTSCDSDNIRISNIDLHLLSLFHQLNNAGKEAVLTAAEGAVMNSKYVSKSSKETTSTEIDNENHA